MTTPIYLDHNATTPLGTHVLSSVQKGFKHWGNPSSIHRIGQNAKSLLEEARDSIARFLGGRADQLIFTSSATEANNQVMFGTWHRCLKENRPCHIIISSIEHSSIRVAAQQLDSLGAEITVIPVDQSGWVNAAHIEEAIRPETVLISVMYANNETGICQPIKEISECAQKKGVLFHTDAVQGIGKAPVSFKNIGADLMTISGHKMYAPKGIGALMMKHDDAVNPLLFGGSHERRLRAGTENLPGVLGLDAACRELSDTGDALTRRLSELKQRLLEGLLTQVPDIEVNGDNDHGICNTLNLYIPGVNGQSLAINLDLEGICISTGSACSSGSVEPSPILLAMGYSNDRTLQSVRLSLGKNNTEQEVDMTIETMTRLIKHMRESHAK